MRRMLPLLLLFGAIACLAGCGRAPDRSAAVGRWELRQIDLTEAEAASPVFPQGKKLGSRSPAFLNVSEDGSVLYAVRDAAHRAKLEISPRTGLLTARREDGVEDFELVLKRGDRMLVRVPFERAFRHYIALPAQPAAERGDLLGEALNEWRMPARGPLGKPDLRRRTLAMLRYLEVFYNEAYLDDLSYVEFATLHTPLVFAGNGLGLSAPEAVDPVFRSYFTRDEEADEVVRMLGATFREVIPVRNPNAFLMRSRMLDQMHAALERAE